VHICAPAAAASIPAADIAYGSTSWPPGAPVIPGLQVHLAAHEGSEHAQRIEDHGLGEATTAQLHADVKRLSRQCDTGEPAALFLDMLRVRTKVYTLLERRLWPREQADLYLWLGCLNSLMGVTAGRLGYLDAAEELTRAAWACATAIDHHPLLGTLRLQHATLAFDRGHIVDSRDLATTGLGYLSAGPMAADLHLKHARATARLGDMVTARRAIAAADQARDSDYTDDLIEFGGEFALSQATHQYFTAVALAEVDGAETQAAAATETAITLYATGPGPDEQHWYAAQALAGIDLAHIRLRTGALDAATSALGPVFALSPARRIPALATQLTQIRSELAAPIFRNSPQARELDDQIEEFSRHTTPVGTMTRSDTYQYG
jgi:hypothetical protein